MQQPAWKLYKAAGENNNKMWEGKTKSNPQGIQDLEGKISGQIGEVKIKVLKERGLGRGGIKIEPPCKVK